MSAVDRFFVDTNVLLYSVDSADRSKQVAARKWLGILWEQGAGRLSWQVLHEFYVNAVRKLAAPAQEARRVVSIFAAWQPVDTSHGLIERAWHWMDEARISYWDSLIVAAAERCGCAWLLTEDLSEARRFESLTVLNPFHAHPEDFGLTTGARQ